MNTPTTPSSPQPIRPIDERIVAVRGCKVMFDEDLAELYGVETGALNRAVRRNVDRFPEDFVFRLTAQEAESLRCQIGTSKRGGRQAGCLTLE